MNKLKATATDIVQTVGDGVYIIIIKWAIFVMPLFIQRDVQVVWKKARATNRTNTQQIERMDVSLGTLVEKELTYRTRERAVIAAAAAANNNKNRHHKYS